MFREHPPDGQIGNIFEGKRSLFRDLAIGKDDAGYDWQALPVISISFDGYPDEPSLFEEKRVSVLNEISEKRGLSTGKIQSVSGISDVIEKLSRLHPARINPGLDPERTDDLMNVVLLIDEYDYPMTSNSGAPGSAKRLLAKFDDFYSSIKSCYKSLRFSMVTGVTRFTRLTKFQV
jgi:hypothetical protein